MRIFPLLATLLAGVAGSATAQSEGPLQIGLPGDVLVVEPWAFSAVQTEGANLLLTAHPWFVPMVARYALLAPPEGLTLSFCGTYFPNFQPSSSMETGALVIPFDASDTATSAAYVMAAQARCEDFEGPATDEDDISSLLPPVTLDIAYPGLTITSPSGSYDVPPSDILSAVIVFNDRSGRQDLIFTFGPATTQWIATNTTAHVGEVLELAVCGAVINAPIIQGPILIGPILLTGPVTKQDAEAEMAQILGEAPCP